MFGPGSAWLSHLPGVPSFPAGLIPRWCRLHGHTVRCARPTPSVGFNPFRVCQRSWAAQYRTSNWPIYLSLSLSEPRAGDMLPRSSWSVWPFRRPKEKRLMFRTHLWGVAWGRLNRLTVVSGVETPRSRAPSDPTPVWFDFSFWSLLGQSVSFDWLLTILVHLGRPVSLGTPISWLWILKLQHELNDQKSQSMASMIVHENKWTKTQIVVKCMSSWMLNTEIYYWKFDQFSSGA